MNICDNDDLVPIMYDCTFSAGSTPCRQASSDSKTVRLHDWKVKDTADLATTDVRTFFRDIAYAPEIASVSATVCPRCIVHIFLFLLTYRDQRTLEQRWRDHSFKLMYEVVSGQSGGNVSILHTDVMPNYTTMSIWEVLCAPVPHNSTRTHSNNHTSYAMPSHPTRSAPVSHDIWIAEK